MFYIFVWNIMPTSQIGWKEGLTGIISDGGSEVAGSTPLTNVLLIDNNDSVAAVMADADDGEDVTALKEGDLCSSVDKLEGETPNTGSLMSQQVICCDR